MTGTKWHFVVNLQDRKNSQASYFFTGGNWDFSDGKFATSFAKGILSVISTMPIDHDVLCMLCSHQLPRDNQGN